MISVNLIITVASWEPRFILGMERTLERYSSPRLLVYFFSEYEKRTQEVRTRLRDLADQRQIQLEEKDISFCSPEKTWCLLEERLGPNSDASRRVLVDLTTMPREVIWSVLFWLEASSVEVRYIYNHPLAYGTDWLTRNPDDPRLLFKLSGELKLGWPTALVAVTGFDADRCHQAIEFYEPVRVLLAIQGGTQYDTNRRNIGSKFTSGSVLHEHIEIDAFSRDHGYAPLRNGVAKLVRDHNVILCSFGPKPSGIALFRLQRKYPQTALAYIGCKEYNHDYSTGLGEDVTEGTLTWKPGPE